MTMAAYQATVTDEAGAIIAGANIEVRRETPGQPLVQVYSDRAGIEALANPFQADAEGFFRFHAAGGVYKVRAYAVASGFERIWRYVAIGTASEFDAGELVGFASATVNTLTERDLYDDEEAPFVVEVVSDSSKQGQTTRYHKRSNATGDWSNAIVMTGPPGSALVKATSVTELEIKPGDKSLDFAEIEPRGFGLGTRLLLASAANPGADWMAGPITAYEHPSVTVEVDEVGPGSGTHGDWTISMTGRRGPPGNMTGPGSATDGHAVVFDGGSGGLVKSAGAGPLLRSTGDFATFDAKASPAAADIVLIEDSEDDGAKKKVPASAFGGSVTLGSGQILARSTSGEGAGSGHVVGTGLRLTNGALFVDPLFYGSLALEMSEDRGSAILAGPEGNGVYDGFGSLVYVDVAGATGLDTSEAGVLKPLDALGENQTEVSFTDHGGAASGFGGSRAFDASGTATEWLSNQTGTGIGGSAWIGQDFGAGNEKEIVAASIIQGSDTYREDQIGITSIRIQYSDDGSDWTDVPGSPFSYERANTNPGPIRVEQWGSQGSHRYWRLFADADLSGSTSWGISDLKFHIAGDSEDMSVESSPVALQEVPQWCQIIAFLEPGDGALNTDINFFASRDDGGGYVKAAMGEAYNRPDGSLVVSSGILDFTGATSGQVGRWKVETDNTPEGVKLLALGIIYGRYS